MCCCCVFEGRRKGLVWIPWWRGGNEWKMDMPLSNNFPLATTESLPTPSVSLRKRNNQTLTRGLQQHHDNPTEYHTKGPYARVVLSPLFVPDCCPERRRDAVSCSPSFPGIVLHTYTSPSANPSTHGTARHSATSLVRNGNTTLSTCCDALDRAALYSATTINNNQPQPSLSSYCGKLPHLLTFDVLWLDVP